MTTIPYQIYQLPIGHPGKFRDLPDGDDVRMSDDDLVYQGELERQEGCPSGDGDLAVLEELFYMFNVEHPEDFRGHSLSVSDVVRVGDRFYRCESIGWIQVTIDDE